LYTCPSSEVLQRSIGTKFGHRSLKCLFSVKFLKFFDYCMPLIDLDEFPRVMVEKGWVFDEVCSLNEI
jgi:hypothetical protein